MPSPYPVWVQLLNTMFLCTLPTVKDLSQIRCWIQKIFPPQCIFLPCSFWPAPWCSPQLPLPGPWVMAVLSSTPISGLLKAQNLLPPAQPTAMAMSKNTFWNGLCWMHKWINTQQTNGYSRGSGNKDEVVMAPCPSRTHVWKEGQANQQWESSGILCSRMF